MLTTDTTKELKKSQLSFKEKSIMQPSTEIQKKACFLKRVRTRKGIAVLYTVTAFGNKLKGNASCVKRAEPAAWEEPE